MAHIFISYNKKDLAFARHLRSLLQDRGFAVWMDETKLVPSERWWPTIERNIISCSAFIIIMSPDSRESDWVERELLVAENRNHRKPIFPVLLAGNPWSRLANLQYEDMTAGAAKLTPQFVDALQRVVPAYAGEPLPPPLPDKPSGPERERFTAAEAERRVLLGIIVLTLLAIGGIILLRSVTYVSGWNDIKLERNPQLGSAQGYVGKSSQDSYKEYPDDAPNVSLSVTKNQIIIVHGSWASIPGVPNAQEAGGTYRCFLIVILGPFNSAIDLRTAAVEVHNVDLSKVNPQTVTQIWAAQKAHELKEAHPDTCGKEIDIWIGRST